MLSLIDTHIEYESAHEAHTACPFCGGKDRFIVFKDENRYWCRQCQWSGDAIALLMKRDNMSYVEACNRLGQEPKRAQNTNRTPRPSISVSQPRTHEGDVTQWRKNAQRLWTRAREYMLDNPHCPVYAFLAQRHLTPSGGLFGYIPTQFNMNWGGIDVFIPSGLLIAWYDEIGHNPYKINIRRLNPTENQSKYFMVKGSENGLYLSHLINTDSVVVLCEGELDALSVYQATRRRAIGIATGATTGGRLQRYIAKLALANTVLVAFDGDDAGEKASHYWLSLLPNSRRLRPEYPAKDANDMVRMGMNIYDWIGSAL